MAPFLQSTPVHRVDRELAVGLQNIQHGKGLGWGERHHEGSVDKRQKRKTKPSPPPTPKTKKALGLSELRKNFFGTWAEVDTCRFPATPNPDVGTSLHTLEGNEAPVLGYRK